MRVTAILVALITLSLLGLPASAAINQIAEGGAVFIGEYPYTNWTRPPYPEVTRIQSAYPDTNWTRPPYPEVTRIQSAYPDTNWTRPPYPEVIRIQPRYPDVNWIRPPYPDGVTPSNDMDGTTYLSLASSASAAPNFGDIVTFTAKLTYLGTEGLTVQKRKIYPAANQQITLVAPDGSTKTATTDNTGQCTWTETPPLGSDTYTARFDGGTTYGPISLVPLLPSQSSVTFAVRIPTTISQQHHTKDEIYHFALSPAGCSVSWFVVSIYGELKDINGNPLVGAPVEVFRVDTGDKIWTGVTNNDGYYETGELWLRPQMIMTNVNVDDPAQRNTLFPVHFPGDDRYNEAWSN